MKIVIIGSGNTATVLGKKIVLAKHEIIQVMSPDPGHAKILAGKLNCAYTSEWKKIDDQAQLYLVAIPDNALADIYKHLLPGNKLVVHTAGSVSKNILSKVSKSYGVLYPLQSLYMEMDHFPEIPLLVDGNSAEDLTLIYDFAKTISSNTQIAGDELRLKLHLAAVFINNFTNHLYSLTKDYCEQENVDFNMLLPLAEETVNRLHYSKPFDMQTGPAIRRDTNTIQKHLGLLDPYPGLKKMYQFISGSIADYHFTGKEEFR